MQKIFVKLSIHGRKWLRAKYVPFIVARNSEGQEWRIKKEPEGFIFRNTRDNTGIFGCSKTLEELILNALTRVSGITVSVEAGDNEI